jgi:hypothetical protein
MSEPKLTQVISEVLK